jgi:hypothetical protein
MNKGNWTQDEHRTFMKEWEKYGNNWIEIAQVLSTRTPVQIKKHAKCHFKQNLKKNLQQFNDIKSPSLLKGKLTFWSVMLLNNKNIDSISLSRTKLKCYSIMLMHTEDNTSPFLLRKRPEF